MRYGFKTFIFKHIANFTIILKLETIVRYNIAYFFYLLILSKIQQFCSQSMSKIADFRKSHSEYYLTSKGSSLSAFTQKMLFESNLWPKSPTFLQVVLKILFVGEIFAFLPKKLHNGRISLFLMYFDKGKQLAWAILTFCQTCWEFVLFF